MNMSQSSIMAGETSGSGFSGLSAAFVKVHPEEEFQSTSGSSDSVFKANNLVVNRIGFWDLNTIGVANTDTDYSGLVDRNVQNNYTILSINNGQGCGQFISGQVYMQNVRFVRCTECIGSFTPPPPPPCPVKPSNLVLSINAQGKIVLTWSDNSSNETGFIIERKTGTNGTWAALPGVSSNTTTYTDTTVAVSTTYCYRVRTSNCAEYTAEVCITTPLPCPNPPSNLVLGSKVAGKIVISWKDNSTSESCYQIERKTGTGAWVKIGQVAANCTAFTDSTVKPGVSYIYRIRTCECSDYSNTLRVTSVSSP